ncbi:hypothetical protein BDA96_10G198100 [Sorghum bicolor]|uniref:Uncharacterized protein n=1 Tax=Sorghum bicolor TaxID=4558 RepID=A0A921U1B1_SORBI|nr:hypothetical protein BDA96_10G198100 [Sorghum bicolor]
MRWGMTGGARLSAARALGERSAGRWPRARVLGRASAWAAGYARVGCACWAARAVLGRGERERGWGARAGPRARCWAAANASAGGAASWAASSSRAKSAFHFSSPSFIPFSNFC